MRGMIQLLMRWGRTGVGALHRSLGSRRPNGTWILDRGMDCRVRLRRAYVFVLGGGSLFNFRSALWAHLRRLHAEAQQFAQPLAHAVIAEVPRLAERAQLRRRLGAAQVRAIGLAALDLAVLGDADALKQTLVR